MSERFRRLRPLFQLTLVRFREFIREPEAVFWVFVFPILLAAGLGIAFRTRPEETVKVGVVQGTGDLEPTLRARSGLIVAAVAEDEGMEALRTGRIALLALGDLAAGLEFRYDDTRPDARRARTLSHEAVQRAAGRRDPVVVRETFVREAGSRYIDFVVPGLLGMNVMGSGIWGVVFSIVDARKRKLLKRLVATPMSKTHYLLSFLLHRLVLLVFEVATLVGFGHYAFGVPLRGSLLLLAGVCLVASLTFGAVGLLASSRVSTLEGASGLTNLVMLPMWIFSGVFFSSSNFPGAMQPFIKALPLTAVNDALRANMLQGASLAAVAPQLGVLALWLAVSFVLALRLFRWK
jgi:ABC-type multidrug transport system permease subunit